jgi:hypothetical protein
MGVGAVGIGGDGGWSLVRVTDVWGRRVRCRYVMLLCWIAYFCIRML